MRRPSGAKLEIEIEVNLGVWFGEIAASYKSAKADLDNYKN